MITIRFLRRLARLGLMASIAVVSAGTAWAQGATTARGTVTEVMPESGRLIVRVLPSIGEPLERVFHLDELTRVRRSGNTASIATIVAGEAVEITYDRRDGRSVARLLELSSTPAIAEVFEPEPIDSIDERVRYVERQSATLDIFEEEIDELSRASEIRSPEELARADAWSERLNGLLDDARDRLVSLSSTRAPSVWEQARLDFMDVMGELRVALGRARTEITGR